MQHLWFEEARLADGWARHVRVRITDGRIAAIERETPREPEDAAHGVAVPGLANLHSHAFQRGMAGLAERRGPANDDFWTWREVMYRFLDRLTPDDVEAITAQAFAEMLTAGFTWVGEFHYLHNDIDGRPYADPLEMSLALVRAAQRTGIGLTLLPTLYMRSGFGATGLREGQRRFASTPESVLRIAHDVRKAGSGSHAITAGVALHSLRAVEERAIREVAAAARDGGMPLHIHIAEQQLEVDDCLQRHGRRPIEWLLDNVAVDPHWNLVHATRSTPAELAGVQACGASIVICPSTEANLGDGTFDLRGWLELGGRWSIGSDSHVTRSPIEELRLLEYSQRLALRERNVAARAAGSDSTASVLFNGALEGGSAAAGLPCGGLAMGQRADFCVPDPSAPALAGIPAQRMLDALVFSSPESVMLRVCVAGRDVDPRPQTGEFAALMRALW